MDCQVDFEHPGILAGKAFDVGDSRFQVVAAKAHGGHVLDKPFVCVVAEFCEKGGKGSSTGEELNILAGEFIVVVQHAPTSAFQRFRARNIDQLQCVVVPQLVELD